LQHCQVPPRHEMTRFNDPSDEDLSLGTPISKLAA